MSQCCEQKNFDGVSRGYRRALIAVIAINAVMFFLEMIAGLMSGSQSLKADALDFGSDSATYGLSLAVIGMSVRTRAIASLIKSASLTIIAAIILITTLMKVFAEGAPEGTTMGAIGFIALLANMTSVLILLRWRDGDSNVRSVWLCSRNDAIGNAGVILAGGAVAWTGMAWPDLVVAGLLAGLFVRSAVSITSQALSEIRDTGAHQASA